MGQDLRRVIVDRRALAVTVDTTISTATDITLNANTGWVRVNALSKGIYIRGQATASAANWDWFCRADSYIDINIPKGVTVLSFLEQAATANLILAEYD